MQYFGSNNVQGVADSWVESEMIWVEDFFFFFFLIQPKTKKFELNKLNVVIVKAFQKKFI